MKYFFNCYFYLIARKRNLLLKPRFINFLLTYRCNARCLMCNIWNVYQKEPLKVKEELTIDEIEDFLSNNKDFLKDVIHIGFTGGEPLLMRDDFVDIIKLFRNVLPGARLGVQTNGLKPDLARKRLREIVAFYPGFSLAVSIDGINHTHSRIRGIDNAFASAIRTINYAKELGIKHITSGMTLTPYNYREIIQVRDLVEKLGCEFSCFLAEKATCFNNLGQSNYFLSAEQKKEVAKQLGNLTLHHYFMDNLRLLLEGKRQPRVRCFSGFTAFTLDPYGNVKPCILGVKGIDDDVFGNIKKQTLESMLRSEKAAGIKDKIKKCSCWCQCEVSSSVVVSPFDLLWWFLFYCKDKRLFLNEIGGKLRKFNIVKG